ncbi:SafA/ExsA family spore coat assembly protein [Sporosarcina sp. ZBG7A]|uniref:SafA/ExsA family spore coat assembly protein n=1 Tax=Sporosarcina sp. ZBG7A TaxID=1582223 RepID=UPI00069171B4|nr:SafA/ExsA family spore coat assembly protein [Sporosarcina sp. ZBG7A]
MYMVTYPGTRSYDESMEGGLYRVNVHIVVKGDTLWKIARQYGISFEELKKVNAHLANPDYIVPGMKIFLPEGKGTKHPEKHGGKEKHPQQYEKPMKPAPPAQPVPPIPKPTPPAQKPMPKPPAQKPLPTPPPAPPPKPAPKPEVKPQPKPEVKPQPMPKPPPPPPKPEVKPMPKPEPPSCEAPPVPPMPPMQPQPMVHPMFIGIPCGWMPIYDADCHPCAHPMQHHMHQPMAPPMMPQVPVQPPLWNMQPETSECKDESPIMAGQGPGVSPNHCDSMKMWETPNVQMPNIESSTFDLSPPAYCPPEQGYVPQQMPQQGYTQQYPNNQQVPMQGIQAAAQHPQYMHLCSSCGSNMSPTPYYGMPMMGIHPYYGGYQQMGYPQQGNYGQNQMGSY